MRSQLRLLGVLLVLLWSVPALALAPWQQLKGDGTLTTSTAGYSAASPRNVYQVTLDASLASVVIDVRKCETTKFVVFQAVGSVPVEICDTKACVIPHPLVTPALIDGGFVSDRALSFMRVTGTSSDIIQLLCGVTE